MLSELWFLIPSLTIIKRGPVLNNIFLIVICLYAFFITCAFFIILKRFLGKKKQSLNEMSVLKRRRLQNELITAISLSYGSSEDTGVLINNALMMIAMSMTVSRATLARYNREEQKLSFEYEWVNSKHKIKKLPSIQYDFSKGNIFYDTFITRGDVHLVCGNMEHNLPLAQSLGIPELKSCIYVPVNLHGQFWGVLGIEQFNELRAWNNDEAKIMMLAANAVVTLLIKADTERALVSAKLDAESANVSKTFFLSRMSHEMRTPLNAIIGMATIARNTSDKGKLEYCLAKINEASLHQLGIINDVLDMSRIEAGKFDLSVNEFDFKKMIKRIIQMIEYKVNEKEQKLIIDIDPACPKYVITDEQRLIQVLMNLLLNAVKFTSEGGSITFKVKVTHRDRKCTLRFNVIDSGIGISDEQKKKLFTPFEQGDINIFRRFGGTGLGLAISKSIIDLIGGKIWFTSEQDKGSDFTVELSLEETNPADTGYEDNVQQYNLGNIFEGITMLIAEDIEINREIIITMLEETGIKIECAPDGKKALEMFAENPEKYQLILTDIHMPEMDGYEETRKIRELEKKWAEEGKYQTHKQIPIVAMTANVFKEDVKKCLAAGMNDHMGKPVDFNELINKLQRHLHHPMTT
jgi:signal transduction histidine kinase/CheY-like chemotaxis protein